MTYQYGEKPISLEFQGAAVAILSSAMRYNALPTRKMYTENKPTFFVEFSGHTGTLHVTIYATGWDEDKKADYRYYVDLNASNGTEKNVAQELNEILETMERVYHKWEEDESNALSVGK